jgi:uncharacterized membrane protein
LICRATESDYLIEVGDGVIVTPNAKGHVQLNQLLHPTAFGAVSGALWGTLIGWLFLMPLAGAALGAAAGAIGGALSDPGIKDEKMRQAARSLKPGEAGLFLLVRRMTTDKVVADLQGAGGTVISTSFDHAKEEALRAALAPHMPTGGGGSARRPAIIPFPLPID